MPKTQNTKTTASVDSALLAAKGEAALAAALKADNAEALINAWVGAGNAEAVNEVAERGSGAARKAARRGINVLKARGVTIPSRRTVTNVAGPAEAELQEGYLLAPDSSGTVLIVVATRTASSRLRCAFVFVNEGVGVQRIDNVELSQSQLRESLNNAIRGGDYKPVKVPVEYARQRIAEARQRQKERGLLEPLGLGTARSLLEPVPSEVQDHPFDAEGLELSDDDAKDLAKLSASLHALPEFRGWFPPGAALDEMLVHVGEHLEAGKEPAPDVLQARLEEEVKAATDRYFTPERRAQLVKMMKDSALSVLTREGETQALQVVAAMKVTENAGLITDPPHAVPFLRGFFDKGVAAMLAQNQGRLRIPLRKRPEGEAAPAAASEEKPAEPASEG
ncbi:MAG TPA: hypothetical protein VM686_17225 [Polyangiaceae bacterium]|nr:hypothetical protein [Polyangiaceae bacterium]